MTGETFYQRPGDELDYEVSLERWLDDGDTVSSATAVAVGNSTVSAVSNDTDSVQFRVSGGADGDTTTITVTATMSSGQVKTVPIDITIRDC